MFPTGTPMAMGVVAAVLAVVGSEALETGPSSASKYLPGSPSPFTRLSAVGRKPHQDVLPRLWWFRRSPGPPTRFEHDCCICGHWQRPCNGLFRHRWQSSNRLAVEARGHGARFAHTRRELDCTAWSRWERPRGLTAVVFLLGFIILSRTLTLHLVCKTRSGDR